MPQRFEDGCISFMSQSLDYCPGHQSPWMQDLNREEAERFLYRGDDVAEYMGGLRKAAFINWLHGQGSNDKESSNQ